MSQTERILYLDKKMREKGFVTTQEAADEFEVSPRQIKRDIEYLRNRFGAPINYSKNHGYKYVKKFTDLEFANQNLIMSYLTLQSIVKNHQYMPVYAENMLTAIDNEVPSDYKAICKQITYQFQQYDTVPSDYFEDICSSMRDKHCLDIVYTNLEGVESSRIIEPHHLTNYNGSWYVLGFDCGKNKIRTFHVSRIKKLSLTDKKFLKHDADFKKQLQSNLESGFGIFQGSKTTPVSIRFYGRGARIVSTQVWHSKQKVTNGKDKKGEYVQLEFPAADFTEVISKILSFGSSARPVGPKELVDLWKKEIASMSSNANS
ncbi:MAG: transcriptional regulator [Treponema sp.]